MEVGDFLIQRLPVTFADYALFLAALDRLSGPAEAAKRVPSFAEGLMERAPDGSYRVLPVFGRQGSAGAGFETSLPAVGVSCEDAAAYCAWKSGETGQRWRLPTEEEREKAGRGVDGRMYPWGSLEDASLAKCRDSREEAAQPEPVGSFPTATSVYGMADAAGGAWEWTATLFDPRRKEQVLRGGAWSSVLGNLRCAFRFSLAPTMRTPTTGFRCARDLG